LDPFASESVPAISIPSGGIWRVPGARNSYFTGRDSVFDEIDRHLSRSEQRPAVQAIVGLGGIGKTQIAAEFAWRHRKDYRVVWWLPSEDATTLALSHAQLAKRMGLAQAGSADLDLVRHALRRALSQFPDWLLIFDNAPSPQAIQDYLPLARSGDVLITSRDTNWESLAEVYPLPVMTRNESVEFLMSRVGKRGQEKIIAQVAQALGDFPLALEQAGAHIVESRIDFASYLRRFESHWAELLEHGTGLATPGAEYPDSLAMSLELTFRQLEEAHPPAQAMLSLFSFFAGESIPPWILDTAASISERVPIAVLPVLADQECREESLAALRRYSLVEGEDDDLHIHRLVAALARRRLSTVERADLASAALEIASIAFAFDSQDPQTWPACAAVLPHALTVAQHAESLGIQEEAAARLMNAAGRFLMRQDRLPEAKQALTQALNLAKRIHGPFHARLAGMNNDLGRVLQKLGDPIAARELFEKSLRIEENIYGSNDAHSASVVNNYAITLHGDGDLQAAREHFERALMSCQSEYGSAHLRVAMVRNNLACVLRDAGDVAGAREQFELALQSAQSACSETHPVIAQITFNCGSLLRLHGDPVAAERLLEMALKIDRHNHGPVHPDVARDLAELAAIGRRLGDVENAVRFEEQARAVLAAGKAQRVATNSTNAH
jgi:tetratricopeptide (TPR) repeat protein